MARIKNKDVKEDIIQAAFELFPHYGYTKTTIDDIADKCGIAKGSIYLHFKNKEQILIELITKMADDNIKTTKKLINKATTASEALKIALKYRTEKSYAFSRGAMHGQDIVEIMAGPIRNFKCKEEECEANSIFVEFINLLEKIIENGVKSGEFICSNPKEIATHVIYMSGIFMPPRIVNLEEKVLNKHMDMYLDMLVKNLQTGEKND